MPLELDFSRENIAEKLKEWKQEEGRIWGDLTRDMRHELRLRLNEIMEVERDLLVACKWYGTSQARRDERAGYRPRSIDLPQAIAMATKNVMEAIPNIAPNRGQISEGKIADLVVTGPESISDVRTVIIGGKVVVADGRLVNQEA